MKIISMISLSYTVTSLLQDHLKTIDTLRRSILLTPLSPSREQKLLWQATIDRIYGTLIISGSHVTKKLIAETLMSPKKRPNAEESAIVAAKNVLDFIRNEWTGSSKSISQASIEDLAIRLFPKDRIRVIRAIETKARDIHQVLAYLEVKPDHPVLMAATLHYAFLIDPVLPWDSGRLGRAVCGIILAKYGYNVRGMVAPETVVAESKETYQRSLETAQRDTTITSWLEYYSKILMTALERLADETKVEKETSDVSRRLFSLSDRQNAILSLLENPTTTMTNRVVQKRFKVSQITASRDLAKLSSLGLLYPHGKGRSVYYTRV